MSGALGLRQATVLAVLVTAGCADSPSEPSDVGFAESGEGIHIAGLVVDDELQPVQNATVTLLPHDLLTQTTPDGRFQLGPIEAGSVTLHIERAGYASTERQLTLSDGSILDLLIPLRPISQDVPYHQSIPVVAILDCSYNIDGITFPCVPVDRVTGQNVTGDRSNFRFRIPNPGLANVLHEMEFQAQTFSKEMRIFVTEPNQPVFVGGVTKFYYANAGPSPIRAWLTPGQAAKGASEPFIGTENTPYAGYIRASNINSTVPQFALALEQKAISWFTFFHNRPGTPEFTALADK